MTLHITKPLLRASYIFIVESDPRLWAAMPDVKDIPFHVFRANTHCADTDGYQIRVSQGRNGHAASVLVSVAHEMTHILRRIRGEKDWDTHGEKFNRIARRICKRCGFDPKAF